MSDYYLSAAYAGVYPITSGAMPPASIPVTTVTYPGHDGQPFDTPAVTLADAIRWMLLTTDTETVDEIDAFFADFVAPAGVEIHV